MAALAAASIALAACGSDDAAGDGPQAELADAAIAAIADFNTDGAIAVDEDCIREIVGALSDEEAAAGLEVFENPDSDSEAFDVTGEKIEDDCFSPA
ncbi:MAG: hypothetical protein AB8G26_06330 [Ilumatobacter sp.]